MFELPTQIIISDVAYNIRNNGDFRMVLDCFVALNDIELDNVDRILSSLIIFYDGMEEEGDLYEAFGDNLQEATEKMFWFFDCGENMAVNKQNYKLVDWEKDQQLIASAVNNAAGKEIRSLEYLHWWTFMGYYLAVGECVWASVVQIRHKIKTGKRLEKEELKFKRDNPEYFIWDSTTIEDAEAMREIQKLMNQ